MAKHKRYYLWVAGLLCFVVLVAFIVLKMSANHGSSTISTKNTSNTKPNTDLTLSLDDPASLHIIVNKHRQLKPKTYEPADLVTPNVSLRLKESDNRMKLRKEAARALEDMFKQAKAEHTDLVLSSGYRSYTYQEVLYDGYVSKQGQSVVDSQSARPGYSEHQTGWAADIASGDKTCELEACFADTKEGKWLKDNAYKYGFVIRYPKDLTAITGYVYEPWHVRYIGKDTAVKVRDAGNIPLEKYFGLGPAPDYK